MSFYECYVNFVGFLKVLTGKSAHWPAHQVVQTLRSETGAEKKMSDIPRAQCFLRPLLGAAFDEHAFDHDGHIPAIHPHGFVDPARTYILRFQKINTILGKYVKFYRFLKNRYSESNPGNLDRSLVESISSDSIGSPSPSVSQLW